MLFLIMTFILFVSNVLALNYRMWQVWTLSLLMTVLAASGKITAGEDAPGNNVTLETALPTNSSALAACFNTLSSAPRLMQQYQQLELIITAMLNTLDGLLACAKMKEYINTPIQ